MKKRNYILALGLMAALMLSACGSKQTENVQTQAATQAAAAETTAAAEESTEAAAEESSQAAVPAELPDDFDEEYFSGVVTAFDGTTITLKNDDGQSKEFDIAAAERYDEGLLMEGCFAEIGYATLADGKEAALDVNVEMDIEQQAAIENRDPVIAGTVQLNDINDLEIIDQCGAERVLDNSMARTVAFSDIKNGDKVYVTYLGSLLNPEENPDEENPIENPITIKIVAADALNSEEAAANYLTGVIDHIDHENGNLTLSTDAVNFEVSAPEHMLNGLDEEDDIRVYYEGALSGIMVDAVKIEKQ